MTTEYNYKLHFQIIYVSQIYLTTENIKTRLLKQ